MNNTHVVTKLNIKSQGLSKSKNAAIQSAKKLNIDKQQILCNLNSNITEMLFEDISNIFVIVNFPLEKCHVSQISQTISILNKAFFTIHFEFLFGYSTLRLS
jgi:hypothetical protein